MIVRAIPKKCRSMEIICMSLSRSTPQRDAEGSEKRVKIAVRTYAVRVRIGGLNRVAIPLCENCRCVLLLCTPRYVAAESTIVARSLLLRESRSGL